MTTTQSKVHVRVVLDVFVVADSNANVGELLKDCSFIVAAEHHREEMEVQDVQVLETGVTDSR